MDPMHVLLVEDSNADAELVRHAFRATHIGVMIEHAETLAGAIAKAGATLYDMVFLDLKLPNGAGIETLRLFRKAVPEVPVVVFTGSSDPHVIQEAFNIGALDYIVKSKLDPKRLIDAVALVRRECARYKKFAKGRRSVEEGMEQLTGEVHVP